MKISGSINLSVISLLVTSASSQLLVIPSSFKEVELPSNPAEPAINQAPIMNVPNIALPPSNQDNAPSDASGDTIISDVLGNDRAINIFAGFTRDIETIARRLQDNAQNTTVLAPLNSEITKLPRKPWEDPQEYGALGEDAYEGKGGEDRAHRNLRRFVEAHVVPSSPWKEGEKAETIGGAKIWWENKDGKKTVQPGNIEVLSVLNKVTNGEVWMLKGVINYLL
ncbi:MAG: hypothetical protein M1827_004711 [Pycnora praestabilis]|nr:MAG: hypothetical protein M1827_004711 [Pycnora praestabilis]